MEFTPTHAEETSGTGLSIDLDSLPKEANDTLSFETKDEEIQAFVAKLKRRRLMRKLSFVAMAALALLAIVLILSI